MYTHNVPHSPAAPFLSIYPRHVYFYSHSLSMFSEVFIVFESFWSFWNCLFKSILSVHGLVPGGVKSVYNLLGLRRIGIVVEKISNIVFLSLAGLKKLQTMVSATRPFCTNKRL